MNGEERPAFLDSHCASDPSLRIELNELLAAEGELGSSFLEKPAIGQAHSVSSAGRSGLPPGAALGGWGDEWLPAEAGIYFLTHATRKTVINLFDLQTRKVWQVYTLEKPTPEWIGGIPVSKNGKFILFPQVDQSSSDLMLIENWR